MSKQTGFLLPRATIHFFVTDSGTQKMVGELESDWRFSRIGIEAVSGDINLAINYYQDKPSPNLLIIETETIDESFTNNLEGLANVCMAHTSVIFIGPVNDIPLYRKLIDMGVTDYVVRPIKTEDMVNIIGNSLVEKMGTSESKFIPVIGAKGGVGASAIAEILSFVTAERIKEQTVLMDGAGGWGTLRMSFGIEPIMQQIEAVGVATNSTQEEVEQLLYSATDKLKILACGGDPLLGVTMSGVEMEAIVNRFMRTHPVVIADLSNAQSEAKHISMARAHHIVLVTTPQFTSLRNARRLLKEIDDIRGGLNKAPVSLVLNMQGIALSSEVSIKDIEHALGIKPTAVIGFNPRLFSAMMTSGKKIHEIKDGGIVLDEMHAVAQKIWGDEKIGNNVASNKRSGLGILSTLFKKS